MGGWAVDVYGPPSRADILPEDDLVEHARGAGCRCDPGMSLVECSDGTKAVMFTHQAADGRELVEQDHGGT